MVQIPPIGPSKKNRGNGTSSKKHLLEKTIISSLEVITITNLCCDLLIFQRPIAGVETFTVTNLCCCYLGKLTVNIRVTKKGFVLGETVPFMVEITNQTSKSMADSKVALIQV